MSNQRSGELLGQRECHWCGGTGRDDPTGMLCMLCEGNGVVDEYAPSDDELDGEDSWV